MKRIPVWAALALLVLAVPAAAQQRPLQTEDPETIGSGRILLEGGIDYVRDQQYPVSGLEGHLWRLPTLGISIGLSPIAELQIDGGLVNQLTITEMRPAPLSDFLDIDGNVTRDAEDIVVATKIRLWSETYRRPAFGIRLATRLPHAGNESGLGPDTTDFFATVLLGKTVESIRIVGNLGVGVLSDPTVGHRQNDVLLYGASLARAITDRAELVGELNGRISVRSGEPYPGTETQGLLTFGARYTTGSFRVDGAVRVGLNPTDPTYALTGGFTYVFNAFQVP